MLPLQGLWSGQEQTTVSPGQQRKVLSPSTPVTGELLKLLLQRPATASQAPQVSSAEMLSL